MTEQTQVADASTGKLDHKPDRPKLKHCSDFLRVWKGQTLSAFGAQMSQFALGIWLFNQTGSVTQFGIIMVVQLLPAMLLLPFAGIMADKFDRRNLMIGCEIGLMVTSAFLFTLAFTGNLDYLWIIYVSPFLALFGAVHQISYTASISLLVPKPLYEKASALIQFGINTTAIVVPLLAVVVLDFMGIGNVILVNFCCYLFSTYTLLVSKYPYKGKATLDEQPVTWDNVLEQLRFGARYVRQSGILRIILFAACTVTFLQGIVHVLFRPLLLIDNDNDVVGWIVTVAGLGGFFGSAAAGTICARYDKTKVIVWSLVSCGTAMTLCAVTVNPWVLGVLALLFASGIPMIIVAAQAMWLSAVPSKMLGRVFATNALSKGVAMIIAAALAPLLSDGIFGPILKSDRDILADFGITYTEQLPIQIVFMLVGIMALLAAFRMSRSRRLRVFRLELLKAKTSSAQED